ncbi:MAG TPA: hypothetical protein VEU62_23820, partial [Bryobacterales bacterium]|nr:hypothetical protein [Bryobacterales bacterium]
MRQDSPAKALAWMATGAAVLAAGAVLGSAAGRRKDRGRRREEHAGLVADPLEDLADRPVARAVLAESVAVARRVETLADSVAGLEARMQAAERAAAANAEAAAAQSAERIEAIWRRVVQIEERLEQIRAERAEMPPLHTIVAQAESRLSPRIHVLETRLEEHHAVIGQLREQASQTEANLQKMIAAVEKLADQVARVLPPQAQRIEPKRESAAAPAGSAAGAAAGEAAQPGAAPPADNPPAEERGTPFRWKSLALVAAISLS